jgi:hypothetical protein
MAKRNLELLIVRNNRVEDRVDAVGDPEDISWLEGRLRGWLQGGHWHEKTWAQFEVRAREASGGQTISTARVV